jgi:phosphatidylserine/phosphatidylglycerophosphate/cardiolipin synthase-like enzyme/uncharacterized membrane protein YdjX (TVP38/TMEM64 family)
MFKPGHNCWKTFNNTDGAFLIDGGNYLRNLYELLTAARKYIYITGWEIDSRIPLVMGRKGRHPVRLADFLDSLTRKNSELEIYILNWDYPAILGRHRESFPSLKFGFKTGPRVRFHLDSHHPVGASQHQKFVVMDDVVAWCGGIDLTGFRWDTRAHIKGDRRRVTPAGIHYGPYHDMMMRVEGQAASGLGELFRLRWSMATGEELTTPPVTGLPSAMDGIRRDFRDATVAVARTQPAYGDQPEVREVEQMYFDLIEAARGSIYIENQYFTSRSVGERIIESLRSSDGPEIAVVQGREYKGWLGERVMGYLRSDLARAMEEADTDGRLGLYYPETPMNKGEVYTLHSKCMIVDDRFVRIGSSNLNNRSMGLDTECDLILDTGDDPSRISAVRRLKADLLAEHLGLDLEKVLIMLEDGRSLFEIIRQREGADKHLARLPSGEPGPLAHAVSRFKVLDPEKPLEREDLTELLLGDESGTEEKGGGASRFLLLLLFLAIAVPLAWKVTPLGEWISQDRFVALLEWVREGQWSWLFVLGLYLSGSLLFVPLNLIIIATATVFGTWTSILYVITGGLLGAVAGYGAGRALGRGRVQNILPGKFNKAAKRISRKGFLPVLFVRIFPVAPNTAINLAAGAIRIRFRDYLLGTILGFVPGGISLTLFQRGIIHFLTDPGPLQAALLAGLLAFITLAYLLLQRTYGDE